MDSITITINGLIASGRGGMTILELAREMGIYIPTLCHDPELSSAGACRICLVEEEKTGALLASCVAPISPGMVINTDSPRVVASRKMIVKMMLASHPESCLLCEKGNRCQLRKIAADLNIGVLDLYKLPNYSGTYEVNPFLKRDLSKCILCGKCIRADQELVVEGAIDYFQRGFAAKPATLDDQPLERSTCTFCGTCVSLCPTGALSEKDKPLLSSPLKSLPSICPYCACGCALSLRTNDLGLVEVEPQRERKTANQATLCVKGHYGWDFINSEERLTTPLLRQEGNWRECSWEEAFNLAVEKLKSTSVKYGPEAVAFLGSSKCTNEENYLFQKLARWGIGTNNIDHSSHIYGLPAPQVFGADWGWGTMTRPLTDLEEAKCILVIGANPAETAPLLAYKIKRAVRFKKGRLILIDPRWTRLVPFADPWLRPQFGQDGLLICGFLRVILEEGLFAHQCLEDSWGWADFKEEVNSFSLPEIARLTGISEQLIRECARQLALQKPLAIVFGNGLWPKGVEYFNLGALLNLSLLTGNLGPEGGGIYPLGKESNGQGARDMGCLPNFLPGYQSLNDEEVRKKIGQVWGKLPPSTKGINAWEMFNAAQKGKIKAMYIMGENPIRSFPDKIFTEKALRNLDFLLVQDLFLTETALLAHLVLPAASFAEKEGTMTSAERRVQLMKVAAQPKGKSLPDWKILAEILSRLSGQPPYTSPGEVLREINEVVPLYRGITLERLERGSICWPCPNVHDLGSPYFWQNSSPPPPRFWSLKRGRTEQDKREEDWLLIWGTTLFHFGSGTRSSHSRRLKKISSAGFLEINAGEAEKRGLREGSLVKITHGSREVVLPISLVKDFPAGVLFWPISGGKAPAAALAEFPQEEGGGFPFPRSLRVKMERI